MSIGWQFYQPAASECFYQSGASECHEKKIEFVHIPQRHREPFHDYESRTEDEITKVAKSQLKVADAIRGELSKNYNCFIIDEDSSEDSNIDSIPVGVLNLLKKEFNRGLPKSFQKLSLIQKRLLCEYGAARVLLVLKEINTIYKCMEKETAAKIRGILDTKSHAVLAAEHKFIKDDREKEVIKLAQKIISRQHHPHLTNFTFLVIFGASHDFKAHCDKEGFTHRRVLGTVEYYPQYEVSPYEPSGIGGFTEDIF
jgi:hypothetical protein